MSYWCECPTGVVKKGNWPQIEGGKGRPFFKTSFYFSLASDEDDIITF